MAQYIAADAYLREPLIEPPVFAYGSTIPVTREMIDDPAYNRALQAPMVGQRFVDFFQGKQYPVARRIPPPGSIIRREPDGLTLRIIKHDFAAERVEAIDMKTADTYHIPFELFA